MARPRLASEYAQLREKLTEAREHAGLTQVELASRLKRTQSFVSKYEMGERKLDVMDFVLICRALGVQPGEVLASLGPLAAKV